MWRTATVRVLRTAKVVGRYTAMLVVGLIAVVVVLWVGAWCLDPFISNSVEHDTRDFVAYCSEGGMLGAPRNSVGPGRTMSYVVGKACLVHRNDVYAGCLLLPGPRARVIKASSFDDSMVLSECEALNHRLDMMPRLAPER